MSKEQQHRLALPQGMRIRDFEFHRVLGHSGFGITYLGWNVLLDIPVVIKEYLPVDLATREQDLSVVSQTTQAASDFQWGLERFLDEARILVRFQHPNIVRVHHFFEAHSTAYVAMDYVEGEDLSAYLTRKGTLSEDELKGILYPLLSALEVIHRADFLHRDIKPGNIVLRDADGSPVLLDFGAARQAIGAKSRSVTSIVTPGYAPIEQYSSRGRLGAWTDIYALGGVCYRALTGQVPEDATDRVRDDLLIPVAERCASQASRGFLLAIDSALSVDEGDRPQNVGAWREALGAGSTPAQERRQVEGERSREQAVQRSSLPEQTSLEDERERFFAVVGREPSPDAVDGKGVTDLRIAAAMNLPEVTTYLLSHGADVHARGNDGLAPLHFATLRNASDAVEVLLRHGADVHAKFNGDMTSMALAVGGNDSDTMEVLLSHGVDVHAKSRNGGTFLHIAAGENASDAAEVLLRHGADVHARENEGASPLHRAAGKNASDAAEVLLRHGADVHAKTNEGASPLLHAVLENASDMVEMLLSHGADVHTKTNEGLTPMHAAALGNVSDAVEVLLRHGADVHTKTNKGLTPMDVATLGNAHKTAVVLRRYGARENKSGSKKDVGCSTALVGMGVVGFVLFFFIGLIGF